VDSKWKSCPIITFPGQPVSKNRDICEMLPLKTKQSGGINCSPIRISECGEGGFLGEISCNMHFRKKDYRERKEEYYSYIIGTWNVRTLNRVGKLENLKKEMQKNEVSVLVVSEVRWKGQGVIKNGYYTMYYSGNERVENGLAMVVHKSVVRSVVKRIAYNDRIIAIKLKAEPTNILIMQVHMPTSEYEDDEVEKLDDIIEEILEEDGKGDTNTIIIGDWNSVVGDESYRNTVGPHGLGRKNHRGQMLINFCEKMD
jgi:nitrogen regulatory protein PII